MEMMVTRSQSDTTVSRRRFLAGAGVGLAGLTLPGLLAGCGGSGSDLTIWMDIAGSSDQSYFNKHVVDAFQTDTGTSMSATYYSGQDLRNDIQTALQAKSGPDVVRGASATLTLAWAKAHLLADLSDYEKQYGWAHK